MILLDVRSRREFEEGHVPGARHLPFWKAPLASSVLPSRAEPVTVYCGHGPRAWMAAAVLKALGYRRVSLLAGHMRQWRRDGKPLE